MTDTALTIILPTYNEAENLAEFIPEIEERFGRCPRYILVETDTMEFRVMTNPAATQVGGAGIAAAQSLVDQGVKVVAITMHERGAVVAASGSATSLDALTADARDVTGAGDAFTATMIHTLLHGWQPKDAAVIAQGAAAITVEADASVALDISIKAARARAGFPVEA